MSKWRRLPVLLLFLIALVGISRSDVPPPPGDALGCYGDASGSACTHELWCTITQSEKYIAPDRQISSSIIIRFRHKPNAIFEPCMRHDCRLAKIVKKTASDTTCFYFMLDGLRRPSSIDLESAAVDARTLPYVQLVDAAMTPALCARVCASRGLALSGTQVWYNSGVRWRQRAPTKLRVLLDHHQSFSTQSKQNGLRRNTFHPCFKKCVKNTLPAG
jgi:hypothetical protein